MEADITRINALQQQPQLAGDLQDQYTSLQPRETDGAAIEQTGIEHIDIPQRKRKVKTPLQKEALELAYKEDAYPNDQKRKLIGEQLGLTDQQVQNWFLRRRRIDRGLENTSAPVDAGTSAGVTDNAPGGGRGRGRGGGGRGGGRGGGLSAASPQLVIQNSFMKKQQPADVEELLATAKRLLPVPFRQDGPLLGCVFDDVPESADSKLFKAAEKKRKAQDKLFEKLTKQQQKEESDLIKERERLERDRQRAMQKVKRDNERLAGRAQKEADRALKAQAKANLKQQKALERLREKEAKLKLQMERKRERQMRKELERTQKATQKQTRNAFRERDASDKHAVDEYEYHAHMIYEQKLKETPNLGIDKASVIAELRAQPFPPVSIARQPAFSDDFTPEFASGLLTMTCFLNSFHYVFGLEPLTMEDLLNCLVVGLRSVLLGSIHIGLMRVLQADLEEAHATVATHGMGNFNQMERARLGFADMMQEAWAWGFDIDSWRAHTNMLTWPEVLRQIVIATGNGPRRPKSKKVAKNSVAMEGEDVVDQDDGQLQVPSRFKVGGMKAAAWYVLRDAGPEGLTVSQITERIGASGLRDLSTCKTPETGVAGALSKDVVFARIGPAKYALQAVLAQHRRQKAGGDIKEEKTEDGGHDYVKNEGGVHIKQEANDKSNLRIKEETSLKEDDDDDDNSDDDDSAGQIEVERQARIVWLDKLLNQSYDSLDLQERLEALQVLVNLCNGCPTVRQILEDHTDGLIGLRKQLLDEARAERRKRHIEASEQIQAQLDEQNKAIKGHKQAGGPMNGEGKAMNTINARSSVNTIATTETGNTPKQGDEEAEPVAKPYQLSEVEFERLLRESNARKLQAAEIQKPIRLEHLGYDRQYNSLQDVEALVSILVKRGKCEGDLYTKLKKWIQMYGSKLVAKTMEMPKELGQREAQSVESITTHYMTHVSTLQYHAHKFSNLTDAPTPPQSSSALETHLLATLKHQMLLAESAMPYEAFPHTNTQHWDRYTWTQSVRGATSFVQLRSALGALESAVCDAVLSVMYSKDPLLVRGAWLSVGNEVASAMLGVNGEVQLLHDADELSDDIDKMTEPLAWLPPTPAAIGLRLLSLDAAIAYAQNRPPARETYKTYRYIQRPDPKDTVFDPYLIPMIPTQAAVNSNYGDTCSSLSVGAQGRVRVSTVFPCPPALELLEHRVPFELPVNWFGGEAGRGGGEVAVQRKGAEEAGGEGEEPRGGVDGVVAASEKGGGEKKAKKSKQGSKKRKSGGVAGGSKGGGAKKKAKSGGKGGSEKVGPQVLWMEDSGSDGEDGDDGEGEGEDWFEAEGKSMGKQWVYDDVDDDESEDKGGSEGYMDESAGEGGESGEEDDMECDDDDEY